MSGEKDENKNQCASMTCVIFAVLNLICKLIPIVCLGYLLMSLFQNGHPNLELKRILEILGMFACLLIPLAWGLYFGIFGIKVSKSRAIWESGKGLFKTLFWMMIIGQVVLQLILFLIANDCRGYGCMIFIYIFPAYWIDIILQLANAIPIFHIWKLKMAVE